MIDAFGVSKGMPKAALALNPAKIVDDTESAFLASRQRAHHMGREASRTLKANPSRADKLGEKGSDAKDAAKDLSQSKQGELSMKAPTTREWEISNRKMRLARKRWAARSG